MDIKTWREDLDKKYYQQLSEYNQHKDNLRSEKEQFIRDNPSFPNPEILFLNVKAPPKRLIIK